MKIALGTAQFGQNYGIANKLGQIPYDEVEGILEYAKANGIEMLDTAIAYGDSEKRLGDIGIPDWQVVSKLPAIPEGCSDISSWVEDAVKGSLERLKMESLYGLLLHKPQQLLEKGGDELYQNLQQLKHDGLTKKIGVSIYDFFELDELLSRYQFDIVQAAFNIVDRRLIDTGWMIRLKDKNVELHVRSVFLQGLLLMDTHDRPKKFDRWASLWGKYDEWLKQNGLTPMQACLRYVLSFMEISKVIIGVDSQRQLKENLKATKGPIPSISKALSTNEPELVNPVYWAEIETTQ